MTCIEWKSRTKERTVFEPSEHASFFNIPERTTSDKNTTGIVPLHEQKGERRLQLNGRGKRNTRTNFSSAAL
jgi:hypothetical protein